MDTSSPPPFLHTRGYSASNQQHQQAVHRASYTALIVIPIIAASILIVGIMILFILRRAKWQSNDGSSIGSSCRRSSLDDMKQVSRCSSAFKVNGIEYSPDVRNCIYGGKLGFAPQVNKKGGQVFTYRELEVATEGFSHSNVIVNGRSGILYRGLLKDGSMAAIKLLYVEGKQGEKEFRMEVDLLSRMQSNYFVVLLGYCADEHHRLLVFEIMLNGCLQKHLHPTTSDDHKSYRLLDWRTRLKIALDSARGLEFLHEHSVPAIIHRDFKCSKILLNQNFSAKVSDFGILKSYFYKANSHVQTHGLGTTGYVAPDRYASNGKLSAKSDVYSYGVVLLELLTGRVPVDITRPQGEHVLVSWALPRLTNREKVMEMVDPALQGQYSKKELIQVAAIAAVCVQSEADYRPLITDVVQSLIPIVRTSAASPASPA